MNEPLSQEHKSDFHLSQSSFISKLKDYKEFIAIIVFFLGGLSWTFGYFATKYQLKEQRCLMDLNMRFVQAQFDTGNLSEMLVENLREQHHLPEKDSRSSEETDKISQLEVAASKLGKLLDAAEEKKTETFESLKENKCSHQEE